MCEAASKNHTRIVHDSERAGARVVLRGGRRGCGGRRRGLHLLRRRRRAARGRLERRARRGLRVRQRRARSRELLAGVLPPARAQLGPTLVPKLSVEKKDVDKGCRGAGRW